MVQNNPNNRIFWHRQMSVPYVSSKTLWIGFDNIRSVTLKVRKNIHEEILIDCLFNTDAIFKRTWLWWSDYLVIRS